MNREALLLSPPTTDASLPRRLYRALLPPLRPSLSFWRARRLALVSDSWTEEEMLAFQLGALRRIVDHAFSTVPWYRDRYADAGYEKGAIRSLEDVRFLPTIQKCDLQENPTAFVSDDYTRRRLEYVTTGGSTGRPAGLFHAFPATDEVEWAFVSALWSRVGYGLFDKMLVLRGSHVSSEPGDRYWRIRHHRRDMLISTPYVTVESLPALVRAARSYGARYLHAFPSSAETLARMTHEAATSAWPKLDAVLLSSETLSSQQRELITSVFECRVFDLYGQTERVALAAECELSSAYHVSPAYSYVELLDRGGTAVEAHGERGEIAGTTFHNYAAPLIRYRTGDVAVLDAHDCDCGRPHRRWSAIEGRLQEYVLTSTGRLVSSSYLNLHSTSLTGVGRYQYHQKEPGRLELRVLPVSPAAVIDTGLLERELQEKLGEDMRLKVLVVNDIPRTPTGKTRTIVQELPIATLGSMQR